MPERFFVLLVFIVRFLDQNLFEKKTQFFKLFEHKIF